MLKTSVKVPIKEDQKDFCDYMGYQFMYQKNDYYIYAIPSGHICRFNLNCANWKAGTFDKEKFIARLSSN